MTNEFKKARAKRKNPLNKKGEKKKTYEPQSLPVGAKVEMNDECDKFIVTIPCDPRESKNNNTLLASTNGGCVLPHIEIEDHEGDEMTVMVNLNIVTQKKNGKEKPALPSGVTVKMNKKQTHFTIVLPYDPRESKSKKSLLLASTNGFGLVPELEVEGEDGTELDVVALVNIFAY